MDHPEVAGLQRADRVEFDPRVRSEFRGAQLSSDGDRLVMRGEKHLSSGRIQAVLPSSGRPVGGCRKNYPGQRRLQLTRQLRDYLDFATASNRRFDLFVLASTKIGRNLQRAIDRGDITLIRFCEMKLKLVRWIGPHEYFELLRAQGVNVDLRDPEISKRLSDDWKASVREIFREQCRPAIERLRAAGIELDELEHLRKLDDGPLLAAAPLLLELVACLDLDVRVRWVIVRELSRKCMSPFRERIRQLYLDESGRITAAGFVEGLEAMVAQALAVLLGDLSPIRKHERELLDLVRDESLGGSRLLFLRPLWGSRSEAVLAGLEGLVDRDAYIQFELNRTIKKIKDGLARQAAKAPKR